MRDSSYSVCGCGDRQSTDSSDWNKPTSLCTYSSAVMTHNRRCFTESEAFREATIALRENKLESDQYYHFTPGHKDFWLESCSRVTQAVSTATTDTMKTGLLYLVLWLLQYTQSAVKFTLTQKSPPIRFSWRAIKPSHPRVETTASPRVDLCLSLSRSGDEKCSDVSFLGRRSHLENWGPSRNQLL